MSSNIKREFVIAELIKLGVKQIDGKSIEQHDYTTLQYNLALKRAINQ